ncbi:hypothetical protein B0G77_8314 [Paraburkholderia sp. BL10I2N1]|nr:hypothetical protein B0G77_8314 [Paraburkholderia sp. BL10I2N1]
MAMLEVRQLPQFFGISVVSFLHLGAPFALLVKLVKLVIVRGYNLFRG